MSAIPPAVIFINADLTDQVQSVLVRQLFISEVISGAEFDNRLIGEPAYHQIVHQQGLRVLVVRSLQPCIPNQCFADVVLFYKAGLITIDYNRCGPVGHTITTDNLTVNKILAHYPSIDEFRGFPGFRDPCVQSNILYPLHCPERFPPLFPLGTDRFWDRKHRNDCSVFSRYENHQCCDKPTCCENHCDDCQFPDRFEPPCLPCEPSYIPSCMPICSEPCPPRPIPPPPSFNATQLQGIPIAITKPLTNQVLEYNGSAWIPATITTSGEASGDLSGNYPNPTVIAIQGKPISDTAPATNQALVWNGTSWTPADVSGSGFVASQDLSGTATAQNVIGLYDHPLAPTVPINSAVPVWDNDIYDIRPLTADDILPGFSISSFGGGSIVEIGATVINPTFTASYSHTPNSAQITNTDEIDSPLVLSIPFTSGTVVGSFIHTTATNTTFTLTAIYSSTKTATQTINWETRAFGGVGNTGAVSATASGTSAILDSSAGTLGSLGLFGSVIGQSFGPFSPTSQSIYLLLPHTSTAHTFKDQFGFSFAMNSPITFSFTNQNGSVISMDLYQSKNPLSTIFTITITG